MAHLLYFIVLGLKRLLVGQLGVQDQEISFTSITAVNENLFCVVSRVIGGTTIYTLEKFADDDSLTLDCSGVTTLNQQGSPLVNGGSQSGSTLNVDGYTSAPNPNDIITIAGDTTEYTIQTVNATASGYTLVLNQTLAATPADNAVITIVQGRLHNTPTHLTSTLVYAVDGTMALGTFTTTASNTITLNEAHAAGVNIGFNFSPELETMPIDKEVQTGPLTGEFKRISRAVIDVSGALNVALQAADRTAKNLVIRQVDFDVAQSVASVTGKKEFYFLGYDRSPTVKVTQTEPLPLKLLGWIGGSILMSAITPATMFMISAGISTAGTLMQLSAQRAAAAEMRRRYEQEAKIAEFEGLQAELQRRREVEQILANNRAVKGASGVGESRSFLAIQQDVRDVLDKDLSNIRFNTNKVVSSYDRAIYNEELDTRYSTIGALVNASTTIVNGWQYHDMYKKADEKTFGQKVLDLRN